MRGEIKSQPELVCLMSVESRVPKEHPLRKIKKHVDEALKRISPLFDDMYAGGGRPSIPPERLLKAKLLMALYSVRSDRMFCEMLRYQVLFLWFLDMDMSDEAWDHSSFSKYLAKAVEHEIGKRFFEEVVLMLREENLVSDDHFTVDGTLIEAWASMKSFVKKNGKAKQDGDGGNSDVNFRGEKRSNQTHQSTSDPEAELMRKGKGKEAKLSFGGHALMENRHGLLMEIKITPSASVTEAEASKEILDEKKEERQMEAQSVGADKGYHQKEFVSHLRENGVSPHIATIDNRKVKGLDRRTTGSKGYQISQIKRKRIEEIFGWIKTTGGFRKTRYRGIEKNQVIAHFIGSAYNLLRMARLTPAPT